MGARTVFEDRPHCACAARRLVGGGGDLSLTVRTCGRRAPQHGDKLRLRGKGIYNVRKGTKGDMYVQLNIIMPKQLTKKQVRGCRGALACTGERLHAATERTKTRCCSTAALQKELLAQFVEEEEKKKAKSP